MIDQIFVTLTAPSLTLLVSDWVNHWGKHRPIRSLRDNQRQFWQQSDSSSETSTGLS